jgi:hypothetical protein
MQNERFSSLLLSKAAGYAFFSSPRSVTTNDKMAPFKLKVILILKPEGLSAGFTHWLRVP